MANYSEYTKEQVISGLSTNPDLALNFAVDNAYTELKAKLEAKGFKPDNSDQVFDNLNYLQKFDRKTFVEILNSVQYNNASGNWTAGYDDIFRPAKTRATEEEETTSNGGFDWGGLLSGIGALASGVGGLLTGGGTTTLTPEQQAELLRQQQEAERKRKQRNMIIIALVVGVLVIVGVIYFRRKKKG